MATLICPNCGTRNASTLDQCRRCGTVLGGGGKADPAEEEELTGLVVGGKWRIEQPLFDVYGSRQYLGRDVATGRTVLIKRLSTHAARDRSIRGRFVKEAQILQSLNHPNVVRVADVVEEKVPSLVMAYPSGEPLSSLLTQLTRLPMTVTITFALQILDALDYVHGRSVHHRNLRPSAIYVGPEPRTGLPHLTLTDFGMAGSAVENEPASDQTGTLLGMRVVDTLMQVAPSPYVAPELLGEASDARSDIYAVGVIIFEMLTGRTPVGAKARNADELVDAIRSETPTMLRLLRPEAPDQLSEVLGRMMAKNPEERYFDVAQARLALLNADVDPMISVPRGPFLRGSGDDDPDGRDEERPMRELDLSAFYVDKNPVTVEQFRRYLDTTGLDAPEDFDKYNPPHKGEHPVVHVTWHEAQQYAKWAGKRLLTEAEWEKAARGTDGRKYPWGNEPPDKLRAQFGGQPSTAAVRTHTLGASPYGALDMAGNAFEWVADWYSRTYYAECPDTDPPGPTAGKKKVLRGGSFVHEPFALRCACRGRYAPEERRANHSFRCAWSLD